MKELLCGTGCHNARFLEQALCSYSIHLPELMVLCRALPVDVQAHMPRVMGAGSNEAPAQGSSLESLEVGWAAARGGAASPSPPADNMAGLNSGEDMK